MKGKVMNKTQEIIQEIIDICKSVPEQHESNQLDDALNNIFEIAKELSKNKNTEILEKKKTKNNCESVPWDRCPIVEHIINPRR
jgi:hypothetical protein